MNNVIIKPTSQFEVMKIKLIPLKVQLSMARVLYVDLARRCCDI